MKKIAMAFVICLMITRVAFAEPLYTKTLKETVTGGVTRTNIQKFYGDYALNINVITADLKNDYLSLELLKNPRGSDKVDTVKNLAKTNENTVAAINADFFSAYKGDQNFSLGIEVKDGNLLQSHINPDMAAGFFEGNALDFSYIEFTGEITAPDGTVSSLAHINKPTDYYGAVLMYTPDFNGGTSPFLPAGITALTVIDDVVTAKGVSLGGTIPIPENGYILVIDDNMTPFLEYKFDIGDKVGVSITCARLTENVKTAFGGGTMLLKDGKKTKITHNVSGNNPRTAIGTNDDGTVVYFITVDGRQTISRGVSLDTLADICLEAGMANALNLDGGGSTAMVAKTLSDESLHSINSPSENRKVINAVGITSTAQNGKTAGFIAKSEKTTVLSGDSVKLYLTPYDENYNKPSSVSKDYKWKIRKGKGEVKNNIYYSSGSGKSVIDLYFNGKVTSSVEINVIDRVCGINTVSSLVLEKGKAMPISAEVFDLDGNTAMVSDISLLKPSYDKSFISVTKDGVTALREGSGYLTLSSGDAIRNIRVISGDYTLDAVAGVTGDPLYKNEKGGFSFDVFGYPQAGTLLERLIYMRAIDTFRSSDASAVVGSPLPSDITGDGVKTIAADKWQEKDYQYAKVLSVSLNEKGVFTRGDQWKKFASAIKNASQKNIFIILDKKADFSASLDGAAFKALLSEAAEKKNVFVVYNGDENFCRIESGVRYISVADVQDEDTTPKKIGNVKYLSFNITKDKATYCFKNLY